MKELNTIQVKLNAPKNQKNTFGNYNYRSCEDILEALKPLLKETKTTLVISDDIALVGDRYYIKATATLTNEAGESVSNSAYAREPLVRKGSDESQITGATSSYARKYALNGLFCIDDNKDPDSTNEHDGSINIPSEGSRGRKSQKKDNSAPAPAPETAPVPQNPNFEQTVEFAINQVALVSSTEELNAVWGRFANLHGKNAAFIKAIQASPFHPNNVGK